MSSDPNKNKPDEDIREDEITRIKDLMIQSIKRTYSSLGIDMSMHCEDTISEDICEQLEERGPIL